MNILITGGAGYIGSHTVVELIKNNHKVVIIDSLINSNKEAVSRIEQITGQKIPFVQADTRDELALRKLFQENSFDAIIHFAGLKAVGESVAQPLRYYAHNIDSTVVLLEIAQEFGVKKFIFSSSATVYGADAPVPYTEDTPAGRNITNPYGQTKYFIEQILQDLCVSDPEFEVSILRYFNPVGAHESGLIGEDPNGIPNNLMPYVSQVAVGKLEQVSVYGDDYDTPDGTGVRDYIHVVDLAKGHVSALEHIGKGITVYNLGTGKGSSVLEIISAFSKASNKKIPYKIVARRPGDLASVFADVSKARRELGWSSDKTIDDACADSWRWQSQNPNGFSA